MKLLRSDKSREEVDQDRETTKRGMMIFTREESFRRRVHLKRTDARWKR
jgi:hypothetical protein